MAAIMIQFPVFHDLHKNRVNGGVDAEKHELSLARCPHLELLYMLTAVCTASRQRGQRDAKQEAPEGE